MITLTVLTLILIILVVVAVLCLSIGGAIFTIIFSDLIVCVAIIAFIMWLIVKKKKR